MPDHRDDPATGGELRGTPIDTRQHPADPTRKVPAGIDTLIWVALVGALLVGVYAVVTTLFS